MQMGGGVLYSRLKGIFLCLFLFGSLGYQLWAISGGGSIIILEDPPGLAPEEDFAPFFASNPAAEGDDVNLYIMSAGDLDSFYLYDSNSNQVFGSTGPFREEDQLDPSTLEAGYYHAVLTINGETVTLVLQITS